MTEKVYAHFIGVGGAGMSGLALVLHERGATVTGSDLKRSRYLNALEQAGMPVMIGHDAVNLGDPEVVVVSSAIPERNPELAEARARGIDVWPRAKMLAHLAGGRRTVAVAGSHGKTSTSSMIATIFRGMGLDPTFLIGGEIAGERTNAANGNGEYYIVEADESDGSFVYLSPHVAVITNIEIDHVDHYKSLADLEGAFAEFISRTVEGGKVVCCADDERLVQLASSTGVPLVTYGASLASDVRFFDAMPHEGGSRFSVAFPGGEEVTCTVQVPGQHMVSNATAALACAWTFGVDVTRAAAALSTFAGVRRRFDLVAEVAGVSIVDDYAHHPTEVAATLDAARSLGFSRIWVLFQPHRYSRTEAFAPQFGAALGKADRPVLMDVYAAGEIPIPGINGKTVLDAVFDVRPRAQGAYLPHRADVVPYLAGSVRSGDLVITMGAGDVSAIGPELAKALGQEER